MSTIQTTLSDLGLDFDLIKLQIMDSFGRDIPTHRSLIREDNRAHLAIVGKGYEPVPTRDAFAFLDPILDDFALEAEITQLLSHGQGEFVSATVSIKGAVQLPRHKLTKRVSIWTSHDQTSSIRATMVPTCVDSDGNEIQIPFEETRFRFKHTKKVADRLARAHKLLSLVDEFYSSIQGKFQQMAATDYHPMVGSLLLDSIAPDAEKGKAKANRGRAKAILERSLPENPTLLDAFLALAEYCTQHRRTHKPENLEKSNLKGIGVDMVAKLLRATMSHVHTSVPVAQTSY